MIKKIAVFNDLSGLGKCSLTAAIPVISALGVQACPVPTAILSNQTGYDSYFLQDCTENIDRFTDEWKKLKIEFDGIYTGFLPNPKQVEKIISFLKTFKSAKTKLVVDPVMADHGRLYDIYSDELRCKMLELLPQADIVTPNFTECCILANKDYHTLIGIEKDTEFFQEILSMCKDLIKIGAKEVVVTGIIRVDCDNNRTVYNCICSEDNSSFVKAKMFYGNFSGTGDLFASVICACLVKGISTETAVKKATEFISASIEDTIKDNISKNDGVNFEKFLGLLVND
ncbi:MAG TPA: pyridoxamine kinase [Clostridia bacterium]|nr:pyridoxamine kinase [Clostridia bacterium]